MSDLASASATAIQLLFALFSPFLCRQWNCQKSVSNFVAPRMGSGTVERQLEGEDIGKNQFGHTDATQLGLVSL